MALSQAVCATKQATLSPCTCFPDMCKNNRFSLAYCGAVRIKTLKGLCPVAGGFKRLFGWIKQAAKIRYQVLMQSVPGHSGSLPSSWYSH